MKALVGVTASGKTEVACRIAGRLNAEIVCADAMTIWRGLDIGTAKPTPDQRAAVPHHLLDLAEPGERPTVSLVAEAARAAIAGIRARGRTPLVVGGSGLYLRAILDDLEFPPSDAQVRARLETLAPDELVRRLRELDPVTAETIDPANLRRVVRALEIIELTGHPASQARQAWQHRNPIPIVGLEVSLDALTERIRTRTDQMLAAGWIEEARRFDGSGRRGDVLSTQAIGYREVFALIDGELTLEAAADRIVRATLKLTKRQMTWFRSEPRIRWIDADDLEAAPDAVLAAYA